MVYKELPGAISSRSSFGGANWDSKVDIEKTIEGHRALKWTILRPVCPNGDRAACHLLGGARYMAPGCVWRRSRRSKCQDASRIGGLSSRLIKAGEIPVSDQARIQRKCGTRYTQASWPLRHTS